MSLPPTAPAGIHAREWIAPVTGLYAIDRLIGEFRDVLDHGADRTNRTSVDYHIMPLLGRK